jgi:hypothetical protein
MIVPRTGPRLLIGTGEKMPIVERVEGWLCVTLERR